MASKQESSQRIAKVGVIPVVRASSAHDALRAARALRDGGIPIVEVTMTVPGAIDAIAELAKSESGMLVGAGTVLDAATAGRCVDAGAQFVVSPGLNVDVVASVRARGILMMAGALTPSEIMAAWEAGSDVIKIFPCDAVGGAKYIRSIKGPFPQIPLIPTGGVNLDNVGDLIRAGVEAVGVGSELVSKTALASGDLGQISAAAAKYVAAVRDARSQQPQTASQKR
ncbi:MAG: bifunctional 4-hydroxy-2-oxoglutarate aldolase/2-dehydro-3-deoxy-phosphogluconate aldolase [Candidatus Acidiferrales bacterium]